MTATPQTTAAFQQALDDCMARVRAGADLDACLFDYPTDFRPALGEMVRAAQRLQAAPHDPDPAFERLLEGRLRAAVAARAAAPPPSPWAAGWAQALRALRGPLLRPVALAGVAAALITGGGVATVQASEGSLPDSPLYVVKTVTEQVALAVAPSEPARQTVLLNQVTQRTDDLLRATASNKSEKVLDTAADRLEQRLSAAVDYALKAEARGNTAPAEAAEQLLESLEARLEQLPPREGVQKAKQAVAEQKNKLKTPPKPAAKPASSASPTAGSPTPRPAATARPTQPAGGRRATEAISGGSAAAPTPPSQPARTDDGQEAKPVAGNATAAQGGGDPSAKPATDKPATKQPATKPTQTNPAAKQKEQSQTVKPEQPAFTPPTPVKDPVAKPPAAKPSTTPEKKPQPTQPAKPSATPKAPTPKPAASPATAPRKTEGADTGKPAPSPAAKPPQAPAAPAAQPPAATATAKPPAPAASPTAAKGR